MEELLQKLIDRLTTLEDEFDSLPDLSIIQSMIKDIEALKQQDNLDSQFIKEQIKIFATGFFDNKSTELLSELRQSYEAIKKLNTDLIDTSKSELITKVNQDFTNLSNEFTSKYDSFKNALVKLSNDYQIELDDKVNNALAEINAKLKTVKNGIDGKDGLKGDKGDKGNDGVNGLDGKDGVGISNITYKLGNLIIQLSDNTTKTIKLNIPQMLGGGGGVSQQTVTQMINDALSGGTGSGDMLKSIYDTNNSGIVDNAEKVNGLTVETAVPIGAVFTDTIYDDSAILSSLSNKIDSSLIGASNGLATLDINSKVTLSQIPDSILGQLEYQGIYDFSSSLPTATQKGQYWICSVSGNGYTIGDWAVWNGSSFDKVDNTDAVSSVNGQTGNVSIVNISGNAETVTDGLYTSDIGTTVQELLISGTNIKSINGSSVLGSGDLEISAGSGGYAANVYFTSITSTTNESYNQLSYTPDATGTTLSGTVNNNEVLIQSFIFDGDVKTTTIPAGEWAVHFHRKVGSTNGITKIRFEIFARTSGGSETTLFSVSSNDINDTSYTLENISTTQPIFTVNQTDRIGIRAYINTTSNSNETVDISIGDGSASYFNTPLQIRHSQLRARDEADSHPISAITNLQSILDSKSEQNLFIQTNEPVLASGKTALWIDTSNDDIMFNIVIGD